MNKFIDKIIVGDCKDKLVLLPDELVQCIVTSPPYWGLRNYGIKPVIWQDDWYGVFGDEPTPEMYVDHFSMIAQELWRILKKDGTFWLNLGDSYAGSGGPGGDYKNGHGGDVYGRQYNRMPSGLKAKDLVGIPWRVALRLQQDGWYLRQDIIWNKNNPMPESVKDRCTKSHEYIFLLSKSARYYFDYEAIKEPATYVETKPRLSGMQRNGNKYRDKVKYGGGGSSFNGHSGCYKADGTLINPDGKRHKRSVWTFPTAQYAKAHFAVFPETLPENCILAGSAKGDIILDPFGGSGTTAVVAQRLERKFILIETNPKYANDAEQRIFNDNPLFSSVEVVI